VASAMGELCAPQVEVTVVFVLAEIAVRVAMAAAAGGDKEQEEVYTGSRCEHRSIALWRRTAPWDTPGK